MSTLETKLKALVRRHGYKLVQDGQFWRLIECGIGRLTTDRVLSERFHSSVGACDYLCPIVREGFVDQYVAIMDNSNQPQRNQ